MLKILATTTKQFIKYPDLTKKLQSIGCIFVSKFIDNLDEIPELKDNDDKILMLDELNIKDDFKAVNNYLTKMVNVKYICDISSRYHEFDIEKARKLGITYCNNPNTTSQSVAELALMHLMCLVRNQPMYKNKDFDFFGINNLGRELSALSVGILGYGYIGTKIAEICNSLKMKVKVWSRSQKDAKFLQVVPNDIFGCDVIFISVISGEESKSILGSKFINSLNSDKYVIDIVGDDSLYDKNVLIKMVNDGKLAGFGFEAEKPTSKYIETKGNVSISLHTGWGTEESDRRLKESWVNTVVAAYNGKPINIVN